MRQHAGARQARQQQNPRARQNKTAGSETRDPAYRAVPSTDPGAQWCRRACDRDFRPSASRPWLRRKFPKCTRMATVSCGASAAGGSGELVADGAAALKISSNKTNRGASGHCADNRIAKRGIAAANHARPCIAQHGRQFPAAWRAYMGTAISPSRNNGQIERGPANAVGSHQRAAISLGKSGCAQKCARNSDVTRAIPHPWPCDYRRMCLCQDHTAGGALQSLENVFQEIHDVLSRTGFSLGFSART